MKKRCRHPLLRGVQGCVFRLHKEEQKPKFLYRFITHLLISSKKEKIRNNSGFLGVRTLIISIILFFCLSTYCSGQTHVFNKAESISIPDGSSLTIIGDFINQRNGNKPIQKEGEVINSGKIYLSGDVINNAQNSIFIYNPNGRVIFNGSQNQFIIGESTIHFSNIEVDKTNGEIVLGSNVVLHDTLKFTRGNINLNGKLFELKNNLGAGLILNESEDSRFYGNNGYISTTRNFNNGENIAGLGLTLVGINAQNHSFGLTTIVRGHKSIANAGHGSINRYYKISPLNPDSASVSFHFLDSELNGIREDSLDLFISSDSLFWNAQNIDSILLPRENKAIKNRLWVGESFLTLSQRNCTFSPKIQKDSTRTLCTGDSIKLFVPLNNAHILWSNGSTDSMVWVNTPGEYTVEIINSNGCKGSDRIEVIESPRPQAGFRMTERLQCENSLFNFIDTSYISRGDFYTKWLLGNGDSATSAFSNDTFKYSYSDPGIYNIRMIATSTLGCRDTFMDWVRVHPRPISNFQTSKIRCSNKVIDFRDYSTVDSIVDGVNYFLSTFKYFFTPTDSSYARNTTFLFPSSGIYNVSQMVSTNAGCIDTSTHQITIGKPPEVNFQFDTVCLGDTTHFKNLVIADTTYVVNWTFNSSIARSEVNPSHFFSQFGKHIVKLDVITSLGCKDSIKRIVQVDTVPSIHLEVLNLCANQQTYFGNLSTYIDSGTKFIWNYGDSTSDFTFDGSHNYLDTGKYQVSLHVERGNGCIDSYDTIVEVSFSPTADFITNDTCLNDSTYYLNASYIPYGQLSYQWDFGNGNVSTETHPLHLYETIAVHQTKLVSITETGCKDSTIKSVQIFQNPIIKLDDTTRTCINMIELNAGNPGSIFLWHDNTTSQTKTVTKNGLYTVKVINPKGCISTDSTWVLLNEELVVDLGKDTSVCDSILLKSNASFKQYRWNTGDTTQHKWVMGSSSISLSVNDVNGCSGSDTIEVIVHESPQINFPKLTHSCSGDSILLDPGVFSKSYLWNTLDSSRSLTVRNNGIYSVSVIDSFGCQDQDSISVLFMELPQVILGGDTSACGQYMLASNVPGTYNWNNETTDSVLLVKQSGEYWLQVTDSNNCSNIDSIFLQINPLPKFSLGGDTTICNAGNLKFTLPPSYNYLWNDGSTLSKKSINSSGLIWVVASNSLNCSYSDSVKIQIKDSIKLDIPDSIYLCKNNEIHIDQMPNNLNLTWFDDNGNTWDQIDLLISDTGKYWVDAYDSSLCSTTDTFIVQEALYPVTSEFLVASTINIGETVQLVSVLVAPKDVAYHWEFGDGITSSEKHPRHIYIDDGVFDITLTAKNQFCLDSTSKKIIVLPLRKDQSFNPNALKFNPSKIVSALIYPNPNKGVFNLEIVLNKDGLVSFELWNMHGELIDHTEIYGQEFTIPLNYHWIKSGVYVIRLKTELGSKVLKFVKL